MPNSGKCCSGGSQSEIERKRKEGLVPRPCWGSEDTVEHESDGDTNCNWYTEYNHLRIGTGIGGLRNKTTS